MRKFPILSVTAAALCFLLAVVPSSHAATSPLYVKVQLESSLKVSALKPGDVVTGTLARDVYRGERTVFPAGSPVRLTVDKLEQRRRVPNDHWPWVVQFFTPRHEKYPTFQSATVTLPTGIEVPLQVSLIFLDREVQVRAPQNKRPSPHQAAAPTLVLEASPPQDASVAASAAPGAPVPLEPGTSAKVVLLGALSAGKNHPGDAFQARLIEPVRQGSAIVLPEGAVLTGEVAKSTPPRWLSRAGSIYLKFTGLQVPGGAAMAAAASPTGAELDTRSRTYMDAEGGLKGAHPGKAWMAANLGVTAGLGKVADDGTQLLIEAVVSTATDASTAGAARIASACVSGIFLLTRHGRDVVLPRYTEMDIVFDRPTSAPDKK